jgi:hypothetical protein
MEVETMSASQGPKALTLRLAPELHRAITELAHRRTLSVNAFIQQQLESIVRAEEEQARYGAYTLLGQDAGACDVEYAVHAQAEVMLHDEP